MLQINEISDHIRVAMLVEDKVFLNLSKVPAKPLSLSMQSATSLFKPCVSDLLDAYCLGRRFGLPTEMLNKHVTTRPAEQNPGEYVAVWVNHLPDWTLPGTQTVQVMMVQRDQPCVVTLDQPISADVNEAGQFFRAKVASHRAKAVLHIQITNVATGVNTTSKIPFDTRYRGGRAVDGYQDVSIPMPSALGTYEIGLSLAYKSYEDDGQDGQPFLFLADVHVGKPSLLGPGRSAFPMTILGEQIPDDGIWMCAQLPASAAPDATAKIRIGSESHSFSLPSPSDVSVDDQYGHTLMISSSSQTDLSLYIDGAHNQQISLDAGETPLRLPESVFNGQTHHLSLRDASGTVRIWESQALLPAILTPADVLQRESAAPFPDAVFAQTGRRFTGLKAVFDTASAASGKKMDFAQISHALATVEGGYDNVKLKPLSFPKIKNPKVSIIIPAHNKVEVTYLGLCSLLIAPNTASFEVIVVDDASTDETAELENIVSGITVIHNEEPQRFIRACNAGVAASKGEYVVLLNNDVEVTTGWIDELLCAFDRFGNVGLAGSKLLYPDGKLQDAGGIIWGTGNPWNYGNRQNPNEPRFSYARQADYLSGAAMMCPRAIWDEIGGLSQYLEPMYFEDTDFAFKVREAGYSTWFVPSSIVYHYEGMTSGTDVSSGFKRYQEVNRPKFKRRWANDYARFGREGQNPDLEKDRGIIGRVLFVDYTTPRADQDAGSYAALQEIRLVQSLGYKVTFLPTNLAHLGKYTEELQKMGVEVIYAPFYMSTQEYLSRHGAEFDAFYITRFYVANDVLSQIRAVAPQAKVLFNNADLHFLREIRAARSSNDADRLADARDTRDKELDIINQVDVVLSYNSMEHAVIEAYTEGAAKVMLAPWVVCLPEKVAPMQARSGLSFLGGYRHHPNKEGLMWFVREIMPRLIANTPDLTFSIYGSGMTEDIRALEDNNIKPVGFVEEVADAFDPHRVFVAPLLSGAGIKGKVLEALARGIPCVVTPVAAEGIGLRHEAEAFIARTPDDWVTAIEKLNSDDELWQEMSNTARSYMQQQFSFERGNEVMREAFEAADLFLPTTQLYS